MRGTVLVTGATGYLGGHCARALEEAGYRVRRGTRRHTEGAARGRDWVCYGDLAEQPRLADAVAGCDAVVHFAGRAHVRDVPQDIALARRSNVGGTANLAAACAEAGVGRVVFISSALVVAGSCNLAGAEGTPCPMTAYARTKSDAERVLREQLHNSCSDWLILRPPMVYGPASTGNFNRLLRLVASGLPLPLGRATAPKSFIYVDNLMSAITHVLEHPDARNATFPVADAEISSTAGLVRLMASAMDRPARLIPIPEPAIRALAAIAGRKTDVDSLFRPLALDLGAIVAQLGWHPPVSLEAGVTRTVAAWQKKT